MSTITPVEPVRLDTQKHGKRYTAAERDAAFLVYLGAGKRSMMETANLTNVSRSTLYEWSIEDQWEARITESSNVSGSAQLHGAEVARAMFPHLVRLGSDRALRILADDKGNQNAQVKLLLEIWGMHGWVAPKQSMSVVQHLSGDGEQVTVSMKDLTALDPDQLAAWEGSTDDDTEGGEG